MIFLIKVMKGFSRHKFLILIFCDKIVNVFINFSMPTMNSKFILNIFICLNSREIFSRHKSISMSLKKLLSRLKTTNFSNWVEFIVFKFWQQLSFGLFSIPLISWMLYSDDIIWSHLTYNNLRIYEIIGSIKLFHIYEYQIIFILHSALSN